MGNTVRLKIDLELLNLPKLKIRSLGEIETDKSLRTATVVLGPGKSTFCSVVVSLDR